MDTFTLTDLELLTGINSDTIRIWEKRYGFIEPQRTATNRRLYTGDDLIRLLNVSVLYRNNVKISKIAALTPGQRASEAAALLEKDVDYDSLVGGLIVEMKKMSESGINEILLRSYIRSGFEDTMEQLVFPFLRKVGIMWHTGTTGIGEEHFITNLVRQRIISAIDNIAVVLPENSRRVLLFLPEDEFHEVSLLYYTYHVKKLGHQAVYLGQSTPLSAVKELIDSWNPDFVITGTLSGLSVNDPVAFLKELAGAYPAKVFLAGGALASAVPKVGLPNVFPLLSRKDLKKYLK